MEEDRNRRYLLGALGISYADIAKQAGVTRQAVSSSKKRGHNSKAVADATELLISAARFDLEKMETARAMHGALTEFLYGVHDSI